MSRYAFTIDGRTHHVVLEEHADGPRFLVEGTTFDPKLKRDGDAFIAIVSGRQLRIRLAEGGIEVDGTVVDVSVRRAKPQVVRAGGAGRRLEGKIKPPMPGKVVEIKVAEGDQVAEGDVVLVLEAMKMQNDIKAPFNAVVRKVHATGGQNVEAGAVLLELEPTG